jgi:peptidoglycan/xylan/chitin deacetylase (PgdA/CDA1 family)
MRTKDKIALLLDKLFINQLVFLFTLRWYGKHIRVINYHGTPREEMANFEEQLKFYQKYYAPVTYNDLEIFFTGKGWHKNKPGLIISFDDGHRTNYDYALPLLEKYGFTGWFFIPPGLIDGSKDVQENFVAIKKFKGGYNDGRFLMSWDEINKLCQMHVVGCHTLTHHRMNSNDSEEVLEKEIKVSRKLFETNINRPVDVFCWVGGEEYTYTKKAAEKIRNAGYRFSFMTNTFPLTPRQNPLQIQRTNIESDNPLFLVRFQLGFLMDMLYYRKRKRVNQLTQ